jgi:predicted Zn-dependent protease
MYWRPGKIFDLGNALGIVVLCATAILGCGQQSTQGSVHLNGNSSQPHQDAQRLFGLGLQAARAGDSIRAEQYLSLAIDAGFDTKIALPLMLKVCLEGSRLRSALDHAEPYLLQHSEDHALRYLVATIHLSLGQIDAARLNLEELLRVDTSNADAHYLLGTMELSSSPSDSAEHLRTYLRLAPKGGRAAEVKSRLIELQVRAAQSAPNSEKASEVNMSLSDDSEPNGVDWVTAQP